jgi:ubiquinone/menaquinone biosynthesis C-methylase UbiE
VTISQKLFADCYDLLNQLVEWRIFSYRQNTAGQAAGLVLEIGFGTGSNLKYYPDSVEITALEPNLYMFKKILDRASKSNKDVTVIQGYGENIPFKDEVFDTVVVTLVLCMVSDVEKVVSEITRVLKPGGKFYFYEHVSSKSYVGMRFQSFLNPLWSFITTGCNLTRDIERIIKGAGFDEVKSRKFTIRFGTPISLPNVVGVATKIKNM